MSDEGSPLPDIDPDRKRGQELSDEFKFILVGRHRAGESIAQIAAAEGLPYTTVYSILKRAKTRQSVKNARRSGRPLKLTEEDKQKILDLIRKEPKLAYKQILERTGVTISRSTLKRLSTEKKVVPKTPTKATPKTTPQVTPQVPPPGSSQGLQQDPQLGSQQVLQHDPQLGSQQILQHDPQHDPRLSLPQGPLQTHQALAQGELRGSQSTPQVLPQASPQPPPPGTLGMPLGLPFPATLEHKVQGPPTI